MTAFTQTIIRKHSLGTLMRNGKTENAPTSKLNGKRDQELVKGVLKVNRKEKKRADENIGEIEKST